MRRLSETEVRAAVRGGVSRDGEISRPLENDATAIKCFGCGQMEYRAREVCRCGYYLRGQLEAERQRNADDYLSRERNRFNQLRKRRNISLVAFILALFLGGLYVTGNLTMIGDTLARYAFLVSVVFVFGSLKIIRELERQMVELSKRLN
ncbi:hypothetical protein PsAD2_01823 [Pseudovibrio axinellae]|uniref:Uncharacterized protein n=1 Tax=Pseudovibrio axinellae TaxID=989403 RepID=A0A165Z667_9HYPH|nr:hypothetical protein PsAD2_01823 [Pseudovibrio axinellae]SEQ31326.1 hypothetical protein SAMN05421798_102384 [Pseudovibrio axinellae]